MSSNLKSQAQGQDRGSHYPCGAGSGKNLSRGGGLACRVVVLAAVTLIVVLAAVTLIVVLAAVTLIVVLAAVTLIVVLAGKALVCGGGLL